MQGHSGGRVRRPNHRHEQSTASDEYEVNGAGASEGPQCEGAVTSLEEMFRLHATKAQGEEATGADIIKWCRDAGIVGRTCDPGHVDISFAKVKQKGTKYETALYFFPAYLPQP